MILDSSSGPAVDWLFNSAPGSTSLGLFPHGDKGIVLPVLTNTHLLVCSQAQNSEHENKCPDFSFRDFLNTAVCPNYKSTSSVTDYWK